jgi:hypothetical protein
MLLIPLHLQLTRSLQYMTMRPWLLLPQRCLNVLVTAPMRRAPSFCRCRAMAPEEEVLTAQLDYLQVTRKHFTTVLDQTQYDLMRERKEKRLSFKVLHACQWPPLLAWQWTPLLACQCPPPHPLMSTCACRYLCSMICCPCCVPV